jgi:cation transporter-like permease
MNPAHKAERQQLLLRITAILAIPPCLLVTTANSALTAAAKAASAHYNKPYHNLTQTKTFESLLEDNKLEAITS